MEDGTIAYVEQVAMKPFTTMVYIIGPNEDFKISACIRVNLIV